MIRGILAWCLGSYFSECLHGNGSSPRLYAVVMSFLGFTLAERKTKKRIEHFDLFLRYNVIVEHRSKC